MSVIARQSTARTVMVGPVLDADGVAVTDGVVADFEGSVNGGDPAALNGSATLTHRGVGFYSLALTSTDLATVGSFEVTINDTVNACPMKEITVIEEAVYDALFAASALGYVANAPVNVAQFGGSNGTFSSGRPEVNASHLAGSAVDQSGGLINANVKQLSGDATAADNAEAFFDGTGYAGTGNVIPTVTNLTNAPTAGDFTATMKTSVTTAATAATPTAAAVTGAVGSVTGNVGGNVTGSVGSVVGAVGSVTGLTASDVGAIKAKTDNLPSDPADQSLIIAATNTILTDTNAIKAETDKLADTLEDDAGTYRFTTNALEQGPGGGSAPTAADIADAVWEEDLSDHSGTVGSVAEALNAAGASGDPWTTALPGAYGSGTAGKIIGDNINATISSRASQTSVDDLPTNAELATSQAAADDATLAAIAALNNLSAAQVNTEVDTALADVGLTTTITGRIDAAVSTRATPAQVATELGTYDAPTKAELDAAVALLATAANLAAAKTVVDAIKLKTDTIPSDPAETSDIPSAATVAAAVLAAAALDPIDANVQEINDTALTGDGNSTPWGPAA